MATAIRNWWDTLTDVRKGEGRTVFLMLVYGFLAMTSYYVVKPARNALFVERLGADNLPYVYIATAIVVSLVMVVYSRYVHRIGHRTLLLGTFAFLISNLLVFRWFLIQETFLISGIFYVWGKLFPLLLVSQFWLVGNLLLTTRQAKRLFGPIGLGLILGGIAGSSIAGTAAEVMGTENLLLFAAAILTGCALIVIALSSKMTGAEGNSGRLVGDLSGDAVRLLLQNSHLRSIAAILLMTILVTTLVDWQFNRAVELFIQGEDAKTEFFGQFFLGLNIVSVTIQLLLTSFVLRRFGVGVALLALPLGLLVASVGVFLVPLLLTATLAKGTEGALRYSLDQSTRELLFLPVPTDVKYKVKPLIDLAVYRGGTGLGGVLLVVFTNWLGLGIRGVAVVAGAMIVVWVLATFRMRREFKDSVKRLIGIQDVGLEDLIGARMGVEQEGEVRRALQGGDEEEIIYGLGLARHRDPREFSGELRELLHHESPELRARALRLLAAMGHDKVVAEARALLVDPDLEVRIAAMDYVCRFGTDDPERELRDALADDEYGVRAAAIAVILRHGGAVDDETAPAIDVEGFEGGGVAVLEALGGEEDLEARVYAAQLLVEADLDSEPGRRVLGLLLEDPDPAVRHAAMQAAAGVESGAFLPLLVERLAVPRDRNAAVIALATRAPEIRPLLFERMDDPGAKMSQRLSIPLILRESADQDTVDRLVESLEAAPAQLRFEILKTLGKLRRDREDIDFERFDVDRLMEREVRDAYRWARRVDVLYGGTGNGTFLNRILAQRMEEAAERAFRVLGLHHSLEDLEAAWVAVRSDDDLMQQRGFELIDNALPRRCRDMFDPLLNPEKSWGERTAAAEERFGAGSETREDILEALRREEGVCVRSLAAVEAGRTVDGSITPEELREEMASRISLVLDEPHVEEAIDIMDVLQRADVLRRSRVFRDLRGEELAGIAALMQESSYDDGQVVPEETGQGGDVHLVLGGRLTARRDGRILYGAGPEEVFFDPSFLDGVAGDVDTVAVGDTRVLTISRPAFVRLMEERFAVVRGLMAHLGELMRSESTDEARAGETTSEPVQEAEAQAV